MDKTEERPVAYIYIFKSLSESLPSIYIYTHISKKSISLSAKNIHSTLIKIQEEIALKPPYAFKRVSIDGSANCL